MRSPTEHRLAKGSRRHLISLSLGLLAMGTMMFCIPTAGAAFKFLQKGSEIPGFALKTPDGAEVSSDILKKGKAGIVVFWATWSPRSVDELRALDTLYRARKDQGLEVLAINVNHLTYSMEDLDKVRQVVTDTGVSFPVVLDNNLETYNAFGVVATPSMAIIDPSGQIIYEISSFATFTMAEITDNVEVALGIKQPAVKETAELSVPVFKPERKALLYYNLGRNLLKMGLRDKAIDKLAEAAEADAKYSAPRVLLGHLLLEDAGKQPANRDQALRLFTEALDADPKNVSALSGLGDALLEGGKLDEAVSKFKEAVAGDGTYTPALTGLATALARKGDSAAALELFKQALELNPLNPDVYIRRSACYEGQGMLKESARDLRRALDLLLGHGLTGNEA